MEDNVTVVVTEAPNDKVPSEKRSFLWKFQQFSAHMSRNVDSGDSLRIRFDIGAGIRLPSTWTLELKPFRNSGRDAELYVVVSQTDYEAEDKSFLCRVRVKSKDNPELDAAFVQMNQNSRIKKFGAVGHLLPEAVGDELEVHVKFELFSPNPGVTKAGRGIETLRGGGEALENFGGLLETGDNSDFVIKVKKGVRSYMQIKVHKAILGARSSVFQTMLGSGMKEARTGILTITDLSPATVKIMLQFIYTGELEDGWKYVAEELVEASNKYDLPLLLSFLNRNLHVLCKINNVGKLRRLAKLHGLQTALENITQFVILNIDQIL